MYALCTDPVVGLRAQRVLEVAAGERRGQLRGQRRQVVQLAVHRQDDGAHVRTQRPAHTHAHVMDVSLRYSPSLTTALQLLLTLSRVSAVISHPSSPQVDSIKSHSTQTTSSNIKDKQIKTASVIFPISYQNNFDKRDKLSLPLTATLAGTRIKT